MRPPAPLLALLLSAPPGLALAAQAAPPRGPARPAAALRVKILAINDFHGHLEPDEAGARGAGVGGAAVLATYLEEAEKGREGDTLIASVGDLVGASPAESALLADEPTVSFFGLLGNGRCTTARRLDPACNLVGTTGNHEYDRGVRALLRLLHGGALPGAPPAEGPWLGARYPTVVSNVVWARSGEPILPPYAVKEVEGIPIAFIGAVLRSTPTIVSAPGVRGLAFLDEADAINGCVRRLRRRGVHAFVALLHQGTFQAPYAGPTDPRAAPPADGELLDVVRRLDDDVDVVLSGHTHAFTNALVRNGHGVPILVTQARSYGGAFADVELTIDRERRDVVAKSASIVTTLHRRRDGTAVTPDPRVAALVAAAAAAVAPRVQRVVGSAAEAITRARSAAGESALGDLVADAQREQMGADAAFTNAGGLRADLESGPVRWGALFAVQPFGNRLVEMTLTGRQVKALLEQQFDNPRPGQSRLLQLSGLRVRWDGRRRAGERVVEIRMGGALLDPDARITAVVNGFLAAGGDGFTVLRQGTGRVEGPVDLDALVAHVRAHSPIAAPAGGRVERAD